MGLTQQLLLGSQAVKNYPQPLAIYLAILGGLEDSGQRARLRAVQYDVRESGRDPEYAVAVCGMYVGLDKRK